MTGYLVLEGGAEFGGQMANVDKRALELAGGELARVSIIPTAAAPDNNHQRAGGNGVRWFKQLGARDVTSVQLTDKISANDATIVETLHRSQLIYMLGGFTGYLGQTLLNSASWQAMRSAYERDAVIAGSSAGAMVMCQYYFDPEKGKVVEGLGLVPNACVLPHHNTFGKRWSGQLGKLLPEAVLVGIDERTGMIDDGKDKHTWTVYGQGSVTLYRKSETKVYHSGQTFVEDFSI